MADLQAIYRDFGIQGIVPYSFQREGAAYRFLVEKIKEEVSLYFIFSEATSVPYLDVMNLGAYAMAYLSEERAKLICDKLARRGDSTYPIKTTVFEEKEKIMLRIRDLGAAGVQIDDGVFVCIEDLTQRADYDGFKDLDLPMRNAGINASLYLLCQKLASGTAHQHLLLHFFRQVQAGHLLIPVAIAGTAEGALGKDDFIVPTMQSEDGCCLISVFTDTLSFLSACESDEKIRKLFPKQLTYVAEYRFLLELLTESDGTVITVNPGTANLNIDRATFLGLEAAAAAEEREMEIGATESEDPIPDFLK